MPHHSSRYWLLRAEEARAMAEDMHEFAKQSMMEVVATYEKLAAYTRSLEKDGKLSAETGQSPRSGAAFL
jgi:hypothetical protein